MSVNFEVMIKLCKSMRFGMAWNYSSSLFLERDTGALKRAETRNPFDSGGKSLYLYQISE